MLTFGRALSSIMIVLVPVIVFFAITRSAFDASTDFMAFLSGRPTATVPYAAGDKIPILQAGATKAAPGNAYGQIGASNTWTKSNAVTPAPLVPGTSVAVDASVSNGFTLLVGNNNTVLGNPTFISAGQELDFQLTVGAGGFTGFSTASNYKFAGGTAPTWSTAATKVDALHCKAWSTTFLECGAVIDVH